MSNHTFIAIAFLKKISIVFGKVNLYACKMTNTEPGTQNAVSERRHSPHTSGFHLAESYRNTLISLYLHFHSISEPMDNTHTWFTDFP